MNDAGLARAAAEAVAGTMTDPFVLLGPHGTPMLLGGDEFGRSQNGNNNANCQDSPISRFDWKQARSAGGESLTEFTRRLIGIRRRYPLLRSRRYVHGEEVAPDLPDIDRWDERGMRLAAEDWANAEGRALIMRLARRREVGCIEIVAVILNSSNEPLVFNLPLPSARRRLLIDSAHPGLGEIATGDSYYLLSHAAAIMAWQSEIAPS